MGGEISLNKRLKSFITKDARYKVAYGGRGSAKSWTIAKMLLIKGAERKMRILCTREIQGSIRDSVHKLLKDQIDIIGIEGYKVTDNSIRHLNGTEFLFTGLYSNLSKLKSIEGIDICWIEEAESISKASWVILDPTVRKPNSEIWVSLNPRYPTDIIYKTLIKNPPHNAITIEMNWKHNPHLPKVLRDQKDTMREVDYDLYLHVWAGGFKTTSDAQIFKGKYTVKEFNIYKIVSEPIFNFGLDWGFSQDPLAIVRCIEVTSDKYRDLYIDYEAGGVGIEIDHTEKHMKKLPQIKRYKIRADNARPESVSLVRRQNYNIVSVAKWKGSVQDGIEYIRGYRHVYIHPRCVEVIKEFKLYSYKVDKSSGDVLSDIVDADNHYIDALRYSLTPKIQQKRKVRVVKKPKALKW